MCYLVFDLWINLNTGGANDLYMSHMMFIDPGFGNLWVLQVLSIINIVMGNFSVRRTNSIECSVVVLKGKLTRVSVVTSWSTG